MQLACCEDNLPPEERNLGLFRISAEKLRENNKSVLTFWNRLIKKLPMAISPFVIVDFQFCDSYFRLLRNCCVKQI